MSGDEVPPFLLTYTYTNKGRARALVGVLYQKCKYNKGLRPRYMFVCVWWLRAHTKQTDQTTTLCVQEVEIYLERWEVLGALVDVCVERRKGS